MLTLAIDTGWRACSAALVEGSDAAAVCVAYRREDLARGHAERLMDVIAELIAQTSMQVRDIRAIAVTVGPGSFTGLRVGIAAARGLALACQCPVTGVGTLEAFATEIAALRRNRGQAFTICLDARREEFYVQSFSANGRARNGAMLLTVQELTHYLAAQGDVCFVTEDHPYLAGTLPNVLRMPLPHSAGPHPFSVAQLALSQKQPVPPAPVYLRAPDAKPQAPAVARRDGDVDPAPVRRQ